MYIDILGDKEELEDGQSNTLFNFQNKHWGLFEKKKNHHTKTILKHTLPDLRKERSASVSGTIWPNCGTTSDTQ